MTFFFLTGWHNSNGSYSFDGEEMNAKKNVNLNFIFASTANVKPLTANLDVNKINVNLKVSIDSSSNAERLKKVSSIQIYQGFGHLTR